MLQQELLGQLNACHLRCDCDLKEKNVPVSLEGTIVTSPNLFRGPKKFLVLFSNPKYCYVRSDHSYQRSGAFDDIYLICQALKHVGLRPSRKFKLFNGPLECRLVKFELYEGSKKGPR